MTGRELHLELLLNKQVLDSTGQAIGRIEEIRAEQQEDDWVIQEYLIGPAAILERFSAWSIGLWLLHLLGARKLYGSYRIPWNKLDLSDPEHPRLFCTLDDLKALNEKLSSTE
jgi:sporulation protein YlmC with PRC-barrel domain